MSKFSLGIILLFSMQSPLHASNSIKDPVAYYQSNFEIRPNEKILLIQADTNNDGKEEIFLTTSRSLNGKAGFMWNVFVQKGQGYEQMQEIISFRGDAYTVGKLEGMKHQGLIAYLPGGGGEGTLIYIEMTSGKVLEKVLKKIKPEGKDRALYKKLFKTPLPEKYQIKTISITK